MREPSRLSGERMENALRLFGIEEAEARALTASSYDVRTERGHYVLERKRGELAFPYEVRESGGWRLYAPDEPFTTYPVLPSEDLCCRLGKALQALHDRLGETDEPPFSDSRNAYIELGKAVKADSFSRVEAVSPELDRLLADRKRANMIGDLLKRGVLKKSLVHGSLGLSSCLFLSGGDVMFLGLDDVRPGTVLYDTGSLSATASSAEDSSFRLSFYKAFQEGYFDGNSFSGALEKELFAESLRGMAQLEAVRALAAYLSGGGEETITLCRNRLSFIQDRDRYL